MWSFQSYRGVLFALGGGAAAFVALVVPFLWPLSVLGVLGYFASILRSSSLKTTCGNGFLFGVLASMGGVWWFWDTLPLTWIAIPDGPVQLFLVGVVYSLTVISLALPFALVAPLFRSIPRKWYRPFVCAGIYIALEELRMWSFALFFLAPESTLTPNFSIAGLGYTLTESTLLLPLALGGHYALNGFLAFVGALALERRRTPLLIGGALIVVSLLVAHASLPPEPVARTVRVGLISSYAPPGPFAAPHLTIEHLREASSDPTIDVVVTPEGLGLAPFLDTTARHELYQNLFTDRDVLIVSSSIVREENGNEHAELIYESTKTGIVATQHKIFFVPVGEYLPPLIKGAISLAGKENLNGYGSYIAGRAVAGSSVTSATYHNVHFGALLCSELLSPRLYATLADKNTDMLFNLANNS